MCARRSAPRHASEGRLEPARAVRILRAVCAASRAATRGVRPRSKPGHILPGGEGGKVLIRRRQLVETPRGRSGRGRRGVPGTLTMAARLSVRRLMAPEQLARRNGPRTDVFAMRDRYEMLSGELRSAAVR